MPVTNVQWCIVNNAKTLGLQYLQLHNMGVSGGPPDGTRVVHHGTDELLRKQNIIPDGETDSPVEERTQCSHPLCRFLSHLIDICRVSGVKTKTNKKQ
jgi:hypothetical protein